MINLFKRFFLKLNIIYLERREEVWRIIKIALLIIDLVIWGWVGRELIIYFTQPVREVKFDYQALAELHQRRKPGDLVVQKKVVLRNKDGSFDAYFTVENPNKRWMLEEVIYNVDLVEKGKVYLRKSGKTFFEPLQKKRLVALDLKSRNISQPQLEISFSRIYWRKVLDSPQIPLTILQQDLETKKGKTVYQGIVKNESKFIIKEIEIDVFLYSKAKVIELNQTFLYDLKPEEEREFLVFWPERVEAERGEVVLEVNPFLGIKLPEVRRDEKE